MSGFSADWLALREPYDLRARNPAVLDAVVTWCKDMFAIRVVDLGCGTGLVAAGFAEMADRSTGIDLSPAMIAKAQASGASAEVVQAKIDEIQRMKVNYANPIYRML